MSVNKVNLVGRLGNDPELRHTTGGEPVCTFSFATTERYKDKNGQKKEITEWHRIVIFGGLGEVAGKYLKKGSLVYFEGKLRTNKWTDKEGIVRYSTSVIASEMEMLGSKSDGSKDDNTHQDAPRIYADEEIPDWFR